MGDHGLKLVSAIADETSEGYTAIPDPSPQLTLRSTPPARRPAVAPADGQGRFSPLNAPQRAALDAFLAEARPWAERQARRTYRHLPSELHDTAIDRAFVAMRTGAPAEFGRRELYRELASALDGSLRDVHQGWCLNQTDLPHTPVPTRGPDSLTGFIEDGLGGLERAVLQLEIGAGRDSATVRAALKLGPTQYARHRDLGLSKLRSAIAGQVAGSVCAHHVDSVTLAATGDRDAASELSSGPGRCRSCAREANALEGLLHRRLAVAPWPLAIKPAGFLAAKIGAAGALFGGKGAAGGTGVGTFAASSGSGLKALTAVLATAAVATGGVAVVDPEQSNRAVRATAAASTASSPAVTTPAATAPASRPVTNGERATQRKASKNKSTRDTDRSTSASTTPAQTIAPPSSEEPPASSGPTLTTGVTKPTDVVEGVTDRTRKTLDKVKKAVPTVDPANPALPDVNRTLDDVVEAAGSLLAP